MKWVELNRGSTFVPVATVTKISTTDDGAVEVSAAGLPVVRGVFAEGLTLSGRKAVALWLAERMATDTTPAVIRQAAVPPRIATGGGG